MFIAPNQIAPGGVSGLAVVLNYLTRVPIGVWSFFINIPLLLVGLRFLGRRFALRTLKTVVVLSVMIDYAAAPLPAYTATRCLPRSSAACSWARGWRSSSCAAPRRAAAISSPGCSSSGIPISRSAGS